MNFQEYIKEKYEIYAQVKNIPIGTKIDDTVFTKELKEFVGKTIQVFPFGSRTWWTFARSSLAYNKRNLKLHKSWLDFDIEQELELDK